MALTLALGWGSCPNASISGHPPRASAIRISLPGTLLQGGHQWLSISTDGSRRRSNLIAALAYREYIWLGPGSSYDVRWLADIGEDANIPCLSALCCFCGLRWLRTRRHTLPGCSWAYRPANPLDEIPPDHRIDRNSAVQSTPAHPEDEPSYFAASVACFPAYFASARRTNLLPCC